MKELPDLKKLKALSWVNWLERPYDPFLCSLGFRGVDAKYFSRVSSAGLGFCANLYQKPFIYFSEKLSEENIMAFREYFKNHSIFDLSKLISAVHKKNLIELKKIIKSNDDAIIKLSKARELFCLYFPFLWMIYPLEHYYQEKIESIVPKHIKGDVQKWVGDVSFPKKKNAFAKMQDALNERPVEEVQKQFGWLKSRDGFTDFYTIEELKEIKSQFKKPIAHKVKIIPQLKEFASELQELTFFRTDRSDKYYEFLGEYRPIFEEVAKKIGVSFKELAYYDVESIISGKPKKIAAPFSFLYFEGKQYFSQGKFIEFDEDNKGEIRGTPAFPGIVKGRVSIVKHPSELGKVKEGDILVAQMTLPSFMSAMYKAAAIVTDEGSITCHAAIIARELKKPCIIGTKNASKILKDGDFIEVDADKGIVRKLK
jgi:phosphohistidine swiveling domain-containing protein